MYTLACKTSTLYFFSKKRVMRSVPAKKRYFVTSLYSGATVDEIKSAHQENIDRYKLLTDLKFNARDYTRLCHNRYNRFQLNSPIISNAVFQFNGKEVMASQYAMPDTVSETTPTWVALRNLKQIGKLGTTLYQAESANGTLLYSNRSYRFTDWNGLNYELHPFFSLSRTCYAESLLDCSELYSVGSTPVEPLDSQFRGRQEIKVDYHSLDIRKRNRMRSRSQADVMGLTALEAYQDFYSTYNTLLTPDLMNVFNQIMNAKYRNHPSSKFYPEWLHAVGYSLSPLDSEPQDKSNLGGGPQWSNTSMMVLETLCHWYASQSPDIEVTIRPTFFMLFASDLIEKIHYEATVKYGSRYLKFFHLIEPHRFLNPAIPQASDIAQIVRISQAILTDTPPSLNSSIQTKDLQSIQSALSLEDSVHSNKL